MKMHNRHAILALVASGVLWGLSVPLSKLALGWLTPAWLTVARFAFAAPILAIAGRRGLRAAVTPGIVTAGAFGFGGVILLQNAGIATTSVSHASVIVGVVPMLVALIAAGLRESRTRATSWLGYGVALAGIALIAGHGGGGSSDRGDLLVLGSAGLSALFIALQPRLLADRDAAAVTAVQFAAGALVALPVALLTHGLPAHVAAPHAVLTLAALTAAGTVLPFWLFAHGQAHVPAELAGAFVNLEPVVGAAIGWIAFGNAAGVAQLSGAAAVLTGIAISALPAGTLRRLRTLHQLPLAAGGELDRVAGEGGVGGWRARRRAATHLRPDRDPRAQPRGRIRVRPLRRACRDPRPAGRVRRARARDRRRADRRHRARRPDRTPTGDVPRPSLPRRSRRGGGRGAARTPTADPRPGPTHDRCPGCRRPGPVLRHRGEHRVQYRLAAPEAIVLGMISGIGGGMLRDLI
jgi:O-acetylserine/cysteine efflux transporter